MAHKRKPSGGFSKRDFQTGAFFTRCSNGAVLPGPPKRKHNGRFSAVLDARTGKYFIARIGKVLRPPKAA